MTPEERYDIADLLPEGMQIWNDDEELEAFPGRDRVWWSNALGHPRAHRGCCRTCGCATTCLLAAYHDALVMTVIRELDRVGALRKPLMTVEDPRDPGGSTVELAEDPEKDLRS
jgi:hypothetical protein